VAFCTYKSYSSGKSFNFVSVCFPVPIIKIFPCVLVVELQENLPDGISDAIQSSSLLGRKVKVLCDVIEKHQIADNGPSNNLQQVSVFKCIIYSNTILTTVKLYWGYKILYSSSVI
jgi:hypothetical protein